MISSQNIQHTYDRVSSLYDLFFKPWLESGRERAVEVLDPAAGSKILEIGVGTGLGLEYYPRDVEVIGFDYSFGMLKESKQKAYTSKCRVNLVQMDVENLAFADHSFDYLIGAYVLTVVSDPGKAIKEIFRVARPGARVVLVNYLRSRGKIMGVIEDLFHPIFSRLGLFTLDHDLPGLLKQNGADNIRTEPTSFLRTHHIISFTTPA